MDSEHWISSLAAAKRFYAAQLGHVDDMAGIGMEEVEMEMEDDGEGMELELEMQLEEATWPDVACPYCYEDHDIASLCAHLEEDHPYEPHTASGRRMRRFIIPESQALSLLSRDLRDAQLQALLGGGHRQRRSNTTATNISADPLLSSFGLGFSTLDSEEQSKAPVPIPDDTSIHKDTPAQPWESRIDSSLTSEEREQKRKQATDRATFVQGLVLSTLFED
uniref:Protein dehydration-induced 19 C-terminal domain-containing protein n=1 Tax=Oryza meridionalis TaxID=40149 RepID=A0A0E0C5V7_9ORYZ